MIIREGQRAYNFYFILSGTVVITEWSPVTKSSQTKCMLQRGMEFGVRWHKDPLHSGFNDSIILNYVFE